MARAYNPLPSVFPRDECQAKLDGPVTHVCLDIDGVDSIIAAERLPRIALGMREARLMTGRISFR
jgi:hypothetical protein